jgi:capsular polysaccharide biosynthesis protein
MDSLALRERIEVVLKNEEEKVTEIEISLRDILEKIFKKKKLIAVVLIATVLLTYLSIKFFIPFYIPYI